MIAAQTALITALVESQRPASQPTTTVRELYTEYEKANKSRAASWPTIFYLLRPVVAELGLRVAHELQVSDWTTYRTANEGKYSGSTLNQQLAWLKTMLRWNHEQGALATLPHLCKAKPAKVKIARETATTEDDVVKVLPHARAIQRIMVLGVCDAMMRRNEIRQLQRGWLDRERMEIRLPDWACKGRRGRTVFMTRRLLTAIDAIPRHISSPYVLTNPKTGTLYHKVTLGKWWRALAEKAELQPVPGEVRVHLHDGRAGAATEASDRGVPIEDISEMLGHASLETTRIYLRRHGRRKHDALARARERFESGIKNDRR